MPLTKLHVRQSNFLIGQKMQIHNMMKVNIRKPQSFHFQPFPFLVSSSCFFNASVNITFIIAVRTAGRA